MKTFTDNAGRTWTVSINVAAIKRVRGLLDVDLYKLVDDGFQPLSKLVSDPVQLADVLYCLCKDEADLTRRQCGLATPCENTSLGQAPSAKSSMESRTQRYGPLEFTDNLAPAAGTEGLPDPLWRKIRPESLLLSDSPERRTRSCWINRPRIDRILDEPNGPVAH